TYLGYNYRLDEMSAAMGAVQMSRLQELIAKRQQVADWYAAGLKDLPFEIPYVAPYTSKVSWFVYVIRIPKGLDRSKVAENLAMQGIPVRPYFLPIHLQPYMVEQYGYQAGDLPVTEDLGERGLALPFSGVMTREQVDLVCAALKKVL
ncbi:MAG: polysaccharide biosynthesis protein, partial [Anaerolineaceae bacterium]|nr:polysaccharide biosynthesis protein [Anaerolineaceae bacterium]